VIAVVTSVRVRLTLRDDEQQYAKTIAFLNEEQVHVSPMVLLETGRVLEKFLKFPRDQEATILGGFLWPEKISVTRGNKAEAAGDRFAVSADLADMRPIAANAEMFAFAPFDRAIAKRCGGAPLLDVKAL
jgi:predicted nucleic-acid-binding protein